MLRLDPASPPLWRDDGSVQFGPRAIATLPISDRWTDAAVAALVNGTTREELRALARVHGVSDAATDAVLDAVTPALVPHRDEPPLVLQIADDLHPRVGRAVLAGLPPLTRIVAWAGASSERASPGSCVILLAAHRVDPRRAAAYTRDGVTHLPLVLDGASATVGPVVAPGRTACLSCLDAESQRGDPHWPAVSSQLLGRPRPAIDPALAAEAARAARFLLSAPIEQTTRSLHLRVDSFRRAWGLHRPSADCRCRSLEESETASVPSGPDRAPSSTTASAPHA